MKRSAIRAVAFDAVGTLLYPWPSAAEIYAAAALRHGLSLSSAEVAERFQTAFKRQEHLDRTLGWLTSEARERERWQSIVAEVLPELAESIDVFSELWSHFAQPASWRCFPDVAACMADLARRGLPVGLVSNFDGRLRPIVAAMPELATCRWLMISSEVGWRKPAPAIFEAVHRQASVEPHELLLVGDDLDNDVQGGSSAGLRTILLNRNGAPAPGPSISCLDELADYLDRGEPRALATGVRR